MRRIVERPRLLEVINESEARSVLLVAPAGYGKTTLARQWAAVQDDPVWWYTALPGSSDVAQLALGLASALDGTAPGLFEHVAALLKAHPNPARQTGLLAEGLARHLAGGDLHGAVGVIDDYHLIAEAPEAERFFEAVREGLGLRLLVASRVRPLWATAGRRLYGELVELGPAELALTPTESRHLLPDTAPEQLETLISSSRGWPAVLGLAAISGSDAPGDTVSGGLFEFFAEELFQSADEELQNSLTTLALLPDLSPGLVTAVLGDQPERTLSKALERGFLTDSSSQLELHPLVRDYLLTKLAHERFLPRVRRVFDVCLAATKWDAAFELARRFPEAELLDELIETSFKPLVGSSRIATLEQMARHGHSVGASGSPLVELVDAEVAFRAGGLPRSRALARRAARRLPASHRLRAYGYWSAGRASHTLFDFRAAIADYDRALACATADEDVRDALWGRCLASQFAEDPRADEIIAALHDRRDNSGLDLVRSVAANLQRGRVQGYGNNDDEIDEALAVLPALTNPAARFSFLNQCAYRHLLMADYEEALEITRLAQMEDDRYWLGWIAPQAEWTAAAAHLGRRRFALADRKLQTVERTAHERHDGHLLLNGAALRGRLLLALQRPHDALAQLDVDDDVAADVATNAEFVATRALAHAVAGSAREADAGAERALGMTTACDAVILARCARAVAGSESVAECLELAAATSTWDPLIGAARAHPPLLRGISGTSRHFRPLCAALDRSNDHDLARTAGIRLPRRPRSEDSGSLSRRESEVLQLIRQGLTNGEIAKTLFISPATVKVHIRHILGKIGARSRTEAALWNGPPSERAETSLR